MISAGEKLVGLVSLGALLMYVLRREFSLIEVHGESMAPAFRSGDRLVARRPQRPPRRGEVVVFRVEGADYGLEDFTPPITRRVKRVISIPGDTAPAFLPDALRSRFGGVVPAGSVAVAGDAAGSEGSAELGYVRFDRIEGIVIRRLRGGVGPTRSESTCLPALPLAPASG